MCVQEYIHIYVCISIYTYVYMYTLFKNLQPSYKSVDVGFVGDLHPQVNSKQTVIELSPFDKIKRDVEKPILNTRVLQ